jgi:TetR/AcrR family transcriptional repressor of nem operon
MSDIATAIMDAAEQRMRVGGFNGFSFRELAADVGIKSSSVHYHFSTKEKLGAAIVHRYTETAIQRVEDYAEGETDPVKRWVRAFRGVLTEKKMCPCVVLAAGALDLPAEVASEVRQFYQTSLERLIKEGLTTEVAAEVLATITGSLVVANALGDVDAYDRATSELIRERDAQAA